MRASQHHKTMSSSVTSKSLPSHQQNLANETASSLSSITAAASVAPSTTLENGRIVIPGAFITEETEKFLHGHGTILETEHDINGSASSILRSTQAGILQQLGSLLSVKNVRQKRYEAHVGDTVIGRIVKLGVDYWALDIGANQDANLRLSSVNLPSVQRRKTYKDQLSMRQMFQESDLLVAEVLEARPERRVSLQTRSAKYGKLGRGLLVVVDSSLMRRQKQHFWILDGEFKGIRVILGMNGFIWIDRAPDHNLTNRSMSLVSGRTADKNATTGADNNNKTELSEADKDRLIYDKIARVRNAIVALDKMFIPIYSETILDVLEGSKLLQSKDMTESNMLPVICNNAAKRIQRMASAAAKSSAGGASNSSGF